MPTKYKPCLDHEPLRVSTELELIDRAVRGIEYPIREIFEKRCSVFLEEDDLESFWDALSIALCLFALECTALPKRSPNQVRATVAEIEKDPERFLADSDRYDPEAVARVLGECARASKVNHDEIMRYELGTGPGPEPEELKCAAERVLPTLDRELKSAGRSRGGATRNDQQKWLAERLAVLFVGRGGRLTRTTHDGESGPFHAFLEVVLPIIRPCAHRAGFALTVRTMVAHAQKELKASGLWSPRPTKQGRRKRSVRGKSAA